MNVTTILLLFLISFSAFSHIPPLQMDKILKSGSGKSIQTAYKVNTVEEEYDVIRYLKLKPRVQKLYIIDGFFYDAITTNSKIIYFKLITKKLPNKNLPLVI